MPLYEYKCESCGEIFEVMQKFVDEPLATHIKCGGKVHRLISASALQFKGSGWYVNDYAKSGNSEKSADSAKSADSGNGASKKADSPAGSTSGSESGGTGSSNKTSATKTSSSETKTKADSSSDKK